MGVPRHDLSKVTPTLTLPTRGPQGGGTNTAKLATLGLTPQAIFDQVAKQNAINGTGATETGADKVQIRVTGAFKGVDAIAAVPIDAAGKTLRLGDIATIPRGPEDPPPTSPVTTG